VRDWDKHVSRTSQGALMTCEGIKCRGCHFEPESLSERTSWSSSRRR